MDKQNLIEILENPKKLEIKTLKELKILIDKYPYFQSARAVYLKSLKDQGSFRYNNELKTVAAYTTNRTVLFDFITSETFNKDEISHEKKVLSNEKEVFVEEITENIEEISEKENFKIEEIKIEEIKKELEIGKPLSFKRNEKHSFSQWLQLSAHKPIIKDEKSLKQEDKKTLQDDIIEKFITNNPKISRVNKSSSYEVKVEEMEQQPQLMTETLARVYLEQKKYGNAIKAYEILSLKYPEKSGFFADQIKQIRILQNNK